MKYLKASIIIPIIFVASVVAGGVYFLEHSPALKMLSQAPPVLQKNIPDSFIHHVNMTAFDEVGQPKYRLTSSRVVHYPGAQDTQVHKPLLFMFQQQGSPWRVESEKAFLNINDEQVLLKDKVILSREASKDNEFSRLDTEHLRVWPKLEYAESDKAVKITTAQTQIDAIGLEADLFEQQYHLLSQVKLKHLPAGKSR